MTVLGVIGRVGQQPRTDKLKVTAKVNEDIPAATKEFLDYGSFFLLFLFGSDQIR